MLRCFGKPMGNSSLNSVALKSNILLGVLLINLPALTQSQLADSTKNKKELNQIEQKPLSLELYGFIYTNVIYDFKQMDPKWFDVPRPTKLPAHKNQFAPDGQVYFSKWIGALIYGAFRLLHLMLVAV